MTGFEKTTRREEIAGGNTIGIDALSSEFVDYLSDRLPFLLSGTKELSIENIGQVKQLNLPSNWAEEDSATAFGASTFKSYADREHPGAKLCSYYRGERLDGQSAESFNNLLNQPAHSLSRSELQELSTVTRSKYGTPNEFALFSASTSNVNGKRVLAVEGRVVEKN